MKVLVIGATGFVGKAITAELRANSIEVVEVGGPRTASLPSARQNLHFIDITNAGSLAKLAIIDNIDAVIHAAGLAHQFGKVSEEDLVEVNVLGTENVADLASKLKARRFILISSVLVYGREHSDSPITEDFQCNPADAYGRSKLAAEAAAIEMCRKAGIPLTILRPAPVIGEGSKGNFARLIKLIANRRFIWLGKGRNRKSLVAAEDVAKACLAVLNDKNRMTGIYNVSGPAIEMRQIVDAISGRLSRKIPDITIPSAPIITLLKIGSRIVPGDKVSRFLNTVEKWTTSDIFSAEKIFNDYKFSAESDLTDVIRRETDWYIKTR